jgi:hypothetical protein
VLEKYLQLARDAGTAGDRVAAENFLQHADHYFRVVSSMNEGQRPRIGGREISVADVNVHNVSQGLSAAMSGHGHSNASGDDGQSDMQPGNNGGGNGNGNGNGQNRPQHQQHQQQAPREAHGNSQGGNVQGGGDQPQATAPESGGNSHEESRRSQQSDEQPSYPEELLPADQQTQPNGDGGENRQNNNRTGRGRRRGPGRRVRGEGDEPPAGESDGGSQ